MTLHLSCKYRRHELMQTNLIIKCSVWGNCFYLKFAKMSLKMFRKRCAWWSLKISVGRKRIDLSPQPPSTTPETRTEQVLHHSCLCQTSRPCRAAKEVLLTVEGWQQLPKSLLTTQWRSTQSVGPQNHCGRQWLLCRTPGTLRLIPASMDRLHPAQSSSSIWDFEAATLLVKYLNARTRRSRFLYNFVSKLLQL